MSRPSSFLSGLLLIAVAGAGGFLAYRLVERVRAPAVAATGSPAPVAAAAPTAAHDSSGDHADSNAPAAPPARKIPDVLPDFSLKDRDGVPRTLAYWQDKPLLVNFWATWCAPCRREIPLLKRLRSERSQEGLEVVGIAVDFREDVLEYAGKIGLDYPLLIGEQEGLDAAAAFGMGTVFPFSVFADRRHRIVAVKIGELHEDEATFILDRVRDVDQGSLDLQAARDRIAAKLRDLATERAKKASKPADPDGKVSKTAAFG